MTAVENENKAGDVEKQKSWRRFWNAESNED